MFWPLGYSLKKKAAAGRQISGAQAEAIAQRKRQEAGLAPMVALAAPEVSKEETALRFQRLLTESAGPLLISVICEAKTMGHMAASKRLLVQQKPEGRYCCPCNKRADDMHVSGWQHQQAVPLFFGCVVASLATYSLSSLRALESINDQGLVRVRARLHEAAGHADLRKHQECQALPWQLPGGNPMLQSLRQEVCG